MATAFNRHSDPDELREREILLEEMAQPDTARRTQPGFVPSVTPSSPSAETAPPDTATAPATEGLGDQFAPKYASQYQGVKIPQGEMSWEDYERAIRQAKMTGYGTVDESQIKYYMDKRIDEVGQGKPDSYWVDRATGMGAGDRDTATHGPYAGQNFGSLEYQQAGGQPFRGAGPGRMPSRAGAVAAGGNAFGAFGVPQDWTAYERLAAKIQEILGGEDAMSREALLAQMER